MRVPSQFAAIHLAISNAQDGDTILVAPGSYDVWVVFSGKKVTVVSEEGPSRTSIVQAVFQNQETRASVLSGFTIIGSMALHVSGSSPTVVSNVIQGDCEIFKNGQWDASPLIRGNTIRSLYRGIKINSSQQVIFESNDIEGVIDFQYVKGAVIRNNRIRGSLTGYAPDSNLQIEQNVIFGFTGTGVKIRPAGVSLVHNTIVSAPGNTSPAVFLQDYMGMGNCIVVGSPALETFGQPALGNNLFFAPGGGVVSIPASIIVGNGNRVGDPLFVDGANGNFRLMASSPAIDGAEPSVSPRFDLDQVERPLDGDSDNIAGIDIGPYEFVPFLVTPPIIFDGISRPTESEFWWDRVARATNYVLLRGPSAQGPFELVGSTTGTNFVDTTGASGTIYYYAVASVGATGRGPNGNVLRIQAGNRTPVANPDSVEVFEDTPAEFALTMNDTDPDGNTLSIVSAGLHELATITPLPGGKVRVTPAMDSFGSMEVAYVVTDGERAYATGNLAVVVKAVNDPPFVADPFWYWAGWGSSQVELAIYDKDTENSGLKVQILQQPLHGVLIPAASGIVVTHRRPHGSIAQEDFVFRVLDGDLHTDAAGMIGDLTVPANDTERMRWYWGERFGELVPDQDSDGDGVKNIDEYWADTSPLDPNSKLKILSVVVNADGSIRLEWPSAGGVRYRVRAAPALNGPFVALTSDVLEEFELAPDHQAAVRTFRDTRTGIAGLTQFYRLEVVR